MEHIVYGAGFATTDHDTLLDKITNAVSCLILEPKNIGKHSSVVCSITASELQRHWFNY